MSAAAAPTVAVEGDRLELLMQLLDTPAPSGFERPAGDVWEAGAATFAETAEDALGNRYASVNPGAPHHVLVTGHIDEIGFIVTALDEEHGLLRFEGIGGWTVAVVLGQRVVVLTERGPLPGTVGWLAPHQLDDNRSPTFRDLWIDVGAADFEELAGLVRVGDPVVLDSPPHLYPNRRLMSRSLDDRVGSFIALEVARLSAGCGVAVTAVAAVSEETTQLGAETAAYRVAPEEAIVVDVIWTSDVPGDHFEDAALGKGPVITFGAASGSRIGGELVRIAQELDIPVQLNGAGTSTSTDADVLVQAGSGVPTGLVSVPTRYLHSPGELVDLADIEACITLLVAWVRSKA
jgi:putative aminopeptidase FrvX